MSSARQGTGHVASLDGVRGLAILLVLLFHFTVFAHMPGDTLGERVYRAFTGFGWTGVDLFFVLSGFLITGILLDTKAHPHFFRNFYARRILRIFPLYYAGLAILFWLMPVVLPHLVGSGPAGENVWYWTYTSNILQSVHGWTNTMDAHFWSLAVEEQFYLVWPLVVFVARPRWLPAICGAILVGAPVLRGLFFHRGEDVAAYVLTPCRADALAAGALVAYVVRAGVSRERVASVGRLVLGASAALLVVVFFGRHGLHFGDPVVGTIGFSLNATLYAGLVAITFAAASGSALTRVFSARPLRFLGKYSYGIYVFHQPVAALMERAGIATPTLPPFAGSRVLTQISVTTVGVGVSIALALTSWQLLEVRFLRLKDHFAYSRVPHAGAVAMQPSDGHALSSPSQES